MTLQEAVAALQQQFNLDVPVIFREQACLTVKPEQLIAVCLFAKTQLDFAMLTDLSGVDQFGESPRFEVDYVLYSLQHRMYLRLKCQVPDDTLTIPSVTSVWRAANWHEREAFDMYGILFAQHPNLTRILMWEGYPHFPLRKDFPLAGLPADLPITAEGAGRAAISPMLGGPFVPNQSNRTVEREPRQYDTISELQDKRLAPNKQEPV
jgi:NADH-quinone oxidoreductase subunit C